MAQGLYDHQWLYELAQQPEKQIIKSVIHLVLEILAISGPFGALMLAFGTTVFQTVTQKKMFFLFRNQNVFFW